MSLEGNLTAFGLSEILQLIAVQQKSGMLAVQSQERSMVLFFRDGQIMSTRDRRRKSQDPLKDYLTRYGIITRENLIRLSQISVQSKLDLTDVLVSEGVMDEKAMQLLYRDHIQEALHEILTWEQCSYKFLPGGDIIDGIKFWGAFNIEGMLMESMRRIDEFPQMLADFPSLETKIKKSAEPEADQKLTSNEKTIMGLLDGERTVGYLVSHAKFPKFETYEALRHLKEKNLVEPLDVGSSDDNDPIKIKIKTKKRPRKNFLPVAISLILFAAALHWGFSSVAESARAIIDGSIVAADGTIERNRAEEQLRWVLEVYRAKHGQYPETLSALEQSGLANQSFLERIESLEFRYHLTGTKDRYTLL